MGFKVTTLVVVGTGIGSIRPNYTFALGSFALKVGPVRSP